MTNEAYEVHLSRLTSGNQTPSQVLRSFLELLGGLNIEEQEECFEAIVNTLSRTEGCMHVVERLQEGKGLTEHICCNLFTQ